MSDHGEDTSDQTGEIMNDLLVAERHQEITQTSTMQGQIAALVMILRDAHVISQGEVSRWESLSQEVGGLLYKISAARDIRESDNIEDPESQLQALFNEIDATITFTRMMGTKEDLLEDLKKSRDELGHKLAELEDEA